MRHILTHAARLGRKVSQNDFSMSRELKDLTAPRMVETSKCDAPFIFFSF